MKEEIQTIHKKFIKADYPRPFVNSVINQYKDKTKEQQIDNEDDYIIPPYLFEEEKPFILLKLPFCEQNEVKSKDFIKKFHKFTNNNFRIAISWKTREMKTLYKSKIKICIQCVRYIMENVNIVEIITLVKQYEIQSPYGLNIIILITSQNQLNTLKEILIMYSMEDFMKKIHVFFHKNISGRTYKQFLLHYINHH